MRHILLSVIGVILVCEPLFGESVTNTNSLVVSSTEPSKETDTESLNNANATIKPQIYSMHVHTNISNRFATTLITSKVRNLKTTAAETTFSVILPENAFISAFEMEIGGKVYKAYVKEKEEAKKIYDQAVSSGQSAAHVALSARDSKTFTVSVNIEPESKTIFRLTYEELLERQVGQYELVVNIHPGQIVKDLGVQVQINESRPLTFVRTPSLRTGNEISKNDDKLDPSSQIEIINATSATVTFNPDADQQKAFGELLGNDKENGLAGQFVVQYDVERDPQGGEVLVRDGYFVHFFAPTELKPLVKHVVFVLDHSGSMLGRKIEQLMEAMQNILSELKSDDLLSIVRFADTASAWDIEENTFVEINSPEYGHLEPELKKQNRSYVVQATKENIEKAKQIVKDHSNFGLTNIMAGLETGLQLIKQTQEKEPNKYQPMIMFLTDGLPNVGESSPDGITEAVTKLNSGTNRAAIFSLSFGVGADKAFLQKLSSENVGFSRHIYEAADSSLQLQGFYKQISSPLLNNVTFKYVDGVSDVTGTGYPILFDGSEIVVAGKIRNDTSDNLLNVFTICIEGPLTFNASRAEAVTSLERLWAYLTVKQILKERETATNKTELTKKALDLALKYSFVTSVSSLVVVKPNQTATDVDSKPADVSEGEEYDSASRFAFWIKNIKKKTKVAPASLPYPGGPLHSYMPLSLGSARPHVASLGSAGAPGLSAQQFASPSYYVPQPLSTTFRPYLTTRRVALPSEPPTATSTQSSSNNTPIPTWLQSLQVNNENITTPHGVFKLGQSGDVTTYPECPKTPINGTGTCKIIFDCPEVFPVLTDISVYLNYFCPLNEYAGVCCPGKNN